MYALSALIHMLVKANIVFDSWMENF
jgi:hypothetical protein